SASTSHDVTSGGRRAISATTSESALGSGYSTGWPRALVLQESGVHGGIARSLAHHTPGVRRRRNGAQGHVARLAGRRRANDGPTTGQRRANDGPTTGKSPPRASFRGFEGRPALASSPAR